MNKAVKANSCFYLFIFNVGLLSGPPWRELRPRGQAGELILLWDIHVPGCEPCVVHFNYVLHVCTGLAFPEAVLPTLPVHSLDEWK